MRKGPIVNKNKKPKRPVVRLRDVNAGTLLRLQQKWQEAQTTKVTYGSWHTRPNGPRIVGLVRADGKEDAHRYGTKILAIDDQRNVFCYRHGRGIKRNQPVWVGAEKLTPFLTREELERHLATTRRS